MLRHTPIKVRCIGYACGAGAQDSRCQDAPSLLQQHHVESAIPHCSTQWADITMPSGKDRIEILKSAGETLYSQVQNALDDGALPLVFGGDHSMAAFTWQAVVDHFDMARQHGLLWIDAHMDAHDEVTSESANPHGMPIAALLGESVEALTIACQHKPALAAPHVHQLGIRSFEAGEQARTQAHGVHIHYMKDIHMEGLVPHMGQALAAVQALPAFGISIDLDGFDPEDAPGTGIREGGGIRANALLPLLKGLAYHPALTAIEIAEFNPYLDLDNRTFNLIQQLLATLFDTAE